MRLIYILLLYPLLTFGQSTSYVEQNISLELDAGWNMFGYSCYDPMDLVEAFSPVVDKVIIVKNNDGKAYMPEFSFNGIGNLELHQGYQIKLTEAITDFQFCPFLVPLMEGCLDSLACNLKPEANMADGSCEYPELGYDCDGNLLDNLFELPDLAFRTYLIENYPEVMEYDFLNIDAALVPDTFFIYSESIENLDGLQNFSNLRNLFIAGNDALTSTPDLSGLSNLEELHIISNYALTSIPELSGLNNLEHLSISDNDALTSIPDLSGLNNLEHLSISNNDALTSIPDLSGLNNLSELNIYYNDVLTSIPDLSGLWYLSELNIYDNDVLTSIPDLSGLNSLSQLSISRNDVLTSIPDLDLPGSGLYNLNILDIDGNDVLTSIPDLFGLNLKWLTIEDNDALTSIPQLSVPSYLEILKIKDNDALTSIPDLSSLSLSNLTYLSISGNDSLKCVIGYPSQLTIQESWPPICD